MTDPSTGTAAGSAFPSRNDGVTITRAVCSVCGTSFQPMGRRRYCCKRRASPALVPDACRQAAWRVRHSDPKEQSPTARSLPRSQTVYECPSCSSRYLGEQRCPDCQIFCRRVGQGGRCPHCDEPVALEYLTSNQDGDAARPQPARKVGHSRSSNRATPSAPTNTNGQNR
jgi:hypothetical protein